MKVRDIIIVGTSHISPTSVQKVQKTILEEKPGIVAIELDHRRMHALLEQPEAKLSLRMIGKVGINGFVFLWLGQLVQRKLGDIVGVTPGAEMRAAIMTARREKIRIALIDRDIVRTMQRFSRSLTWRERLRFLGDILAGLAGRGEMRHVAAEFDIRRVPTKRVMKTLVGIMKRRYPAAYQVLIAERNTVMAANLRRLAEQNPGQKIVAVVGAGHAEDIARLLRGRKESVQYSYSVSI